MYFSVKAFPKFMNDEGMMFEWWDYKREFIKHGFKTYKFTNNFNIGRGHWLDDDEFLLFVLRYS